MTQEPLTPVVRLQFSGGLTAEEGRRLAAITSASRDPAEVFRHVLMAFRVFTIRDVKERLARNEINLTTNGVAQALDAAWVLFVPQMTPLATPMVGQAYLAAAHAVNGDIPPEVISELAREHVMRVGNYFQESSKEALVGGFNIYLNRRIPARVALERALQGYGLTPKQMVGLTNIKNDIKVATSQPQNLESKIQAYIGRALHQRFGTFATQESHNLTNQANQVAWLWMIEHGQMNPETEKIWITAKDEKVCAICGPLHGMVVPITEQFPVPGGSLWVPGAHTNCRCWVRIRTPLGNLSIAKAMYGITYPEATEDWVETEHPRGEGGRWTDKPRHHTMPKLKTRSVDRDFMSLVAQVKGDEAPKNVPTVAELEALLAQEIPPIGLTTAAPTVAAPAVVRGYAQAPPRVAPVLAPVQPMSLVGDLQSGKIAVTTETLTQANPFVDLGTVAESLTSTSTKAPTGGLWVVLPPGDHLDFDGVTTQEFAAYADRTLAIEATEQLHQEVVRRVLAEKIESETETDAKTLREGYVIAKDDDGFEVTYSIEELGQEFQRYADGKIYLEGGGTPRLWVNPTFPEDGEVHNFNYLATQVWGLDPRDFAITLAHVEASQEDIDRAAADPSKPVKIHGTFKVTPYGRDDDTGLKSYIRGSHLTPINPDEAE